jgi:hypothetical protein
VKQFCSGAPTILHIINSLIRIEMHLFYTVANTFHLNKLYLDFFRIGAKTIALASPNLVPVTNKTELINSKLIRNRH